MLPNFTAPPPATLSLDVGSAVDPLSLDAGFRGTVSQLMCGSAGPFLS
jgi:hypothetical protein